MLTPQAVRQADRLELAVLLQAAAHVFSWPLHFIGSAEAGRIDSAAKNAKAKTTDPARCAVELNNIMTVRP